MLTGFRDGVGPEREWTAADDSSAGSGPDAGAGAGAGAGSSGSSDHYTHKCVTWPGEIMPGNMTT